MARHLSERLGIDVSQLDRTKLVSPEIRKRIGDITFVTATDGNHGRGVAWTARQLRQKAVIYMPKGSSPTRLENIRAEGASASIIDGNYDDAVRLAAQGAREHGWVVVQDTAWQGYEEIPTWIMQGYGTIAAESIEQLCRIGIKKPTHVFLQAGVGSFAGAIQGYFADLYGNELAGNGHRGTETGGLSLPIGGCKRRQPANRNRRNDYDHGWAGMWRA